MVPKGRITNQNLLASKVGYAVAHNFVVRGHTYSLHTVLRHMDTVFMRWRSRPRLFSPWAIQVLTVIGIALLCAIAISAYELFF